MLLTELLANVRDRVVGPGLKLGGPGPGFPVPNPVVNVTVVGPGLLLSGGLAVGVKMGAGCVDVNVTVVAPRLLLSEGLAPVPVGDKMGGVYVDMDVTVVGPF